MKNLIQIKNNIIVATGVADDISVVPENWIEVKDVCEIGGTYKGGVYTPPIKTEPEPVYPALTARQLRLALLKIGKLDNVPSIIAELPSPDKEEAEIEWQYAGLFERHHQLIDKLIPLIGLDENQANQLWKEAKNY